MSESHQMPSLPETYRAIRCPRPNGPWEVVVLPLRKPKPKEVLIRVHASGICNSDHFVKDGSWPGVEYPRIPGHEVIGRVAEIGSDLLHSQDSPGRFSVGDLVGVGWNGGYCNRCAYCRQGEFWTCTNVNYTGFTVDGGHGEYIYATETAVISIPEAVLESFSYAELSPLCCAGSTVFDAIRSSKWTQNDICLVQGIGGLGHLAIQYASKMGLKVYAVSSSSSKRSLALALGAYEYIDSSSSNVVDYIQSLGGAKLIICTAPYSDAINSIIPAVAKNGTITLVSATTDGPIKVDNLLLNMNRATLRGYACGCAPDMEKCIEYSSRVGVKPMVKTFELGDFERAYEGVMANTSKFRNVVVFP